VILIKNIFFIGSETLSSTCYKLSDEYNIFYIIIPLILSNLQINSSKSIPTIDGRNYLWSNGVQQNNMIGTIVFQPDIKELQAGPFFLVKGFPIINMAQKVHPKFSMNPQAPDKPEKNIQQQSKPVKSFRVSNSRTLPPAI